MRPLVAFANGRAAGVAEVGNGRRLVIGQIRVVLARGGSSPHGITAEASGSSLCAGSTQDDSSAFFFPQSSATARAEAAPLSCHLMPKVVFLLVSKRKVVILFHKSAANATGEKKNVARISPSKNVTLHDSRE